MTALYWATVCLTATVPGRLTFLTATLIDEGVEMIVRGAVEKETHCTGGILELNLIMNDITAEGVKHLLNLPKKIINKLKILDLSKNHLYSESCAVLAHLISHMPHLKMLELSFNCNIGQGGGVLLITSLTADNSLEKFGLGTTGIGVEDCCYYPQVSRCSTLVGMTSLQKLLN